MQKSATDQTQTHHRPSLLRTVSSGKQNLPMGYNESAGQRWDLAVVKAGVSAGSGMTELSIAELVACRFWE